MAASIMEFSPNGEFFAFCGSDGSLRIWDTATNSLKQEYVSSSHLSATCTCLKWRPGRTIVENAGSAKRKKRKSEVFPSNQSEADLIALGTSSGNIMMYSVMRGDLQAQWDSSHNHQVNDVSWSLSDDVVYSCSTDSFIMEWNVQKGQMKNKMKTDGPVYSICLCNGDSMLLSASRSIMLWDLAKHTVLQTFTGHSNEVFRLVDVPVQGADKDQSLYFVSAARDDRYVQVWQSKGSTVTKTKHKALATLQLPDNAASVNLTGPLPEDGAYIFTVVTSTGWLLLFRQILNGESKKPLKPKVKLQIATSDSKIPTQLPVLSALIINDEKLLMSYGNTVKPFFEKISYGGLQPENCLVRDISDAGLVDENNDVSKTKTPITPDDVKVLTPGHLVPSKPTQTKPSSAKKKRQRLTSVDMTVEEQLNVMGLTEPATSQPNLQTTSSAVLLAQGLQSGDAPILNHILQNTNPVFIRNTIRKLPIPLIVPLVDELSKRMQGHAQSSRSMITWTKTLLTIHSSYLMTFPDLVQNLSTLYQMMDSRVGMFGRLSRLQGKLELVLSQISDQSANEAAESVDALVTLQDESSDDEMLVPEPEDEANTRWDSELDDEDMEDEDEEEEEEEDEEESKEDDERDSDAVDDRNGDDDELDDEGEDDIDMKDD